MTNIKTVKELVDFLETLESHDIPVETYSTYGINIVEKSNSGKVDKIIIGDYIDGVD